MPPTEPAPELVETLRATSADLSRLVASLPAGLRDPETNALILDRLAEELAEASAMFRALPGRPEPMTGHACQALAACRSAVAAGEPIDQFIASVRAALGASS
jgi:hypothetical protein